MHIKLNSQWAALQSVQTEMFSVRIWSRSQCQNVAGKMTSCSTDAVRLQQNFCLRSCCVCVCVWGVDCDYSEEDEKERRQLIEQVFELQNTLDGISLSLCLSFSRLSVSLSLFLSLCWQTLLFRGYHTAVFISAHISSPSIQNCRPSLMITANFVSAFHNSMVITNLCRCHCPRYVLQ